MAGNNTNNNFNVQLMAWGKNMNSYPIFIQIYNFIKNKINMKHIKYLKEWQDYLQLQADAVNMTREEWIAVHGTSIQGIDEDISIDASLDKTMKYVN